jgi:MGT family glycosyltransferase
MSNISVFLDLEEGHSLPIYKLLRRLKDREHGVCCHGLGHIGDSVRRQGFEFIPIIDDVLPRGNGQRERLLATYARDGIRDLYFESLVRGKVLDRLMAELKPDLGIFICHYYLEALAVHFRYQLPIVFFVPIFRAGNRAQASEAIVEALLKIKSGAAELLELITKAGVSIRNLNDVSQLVLQMPELMVLPEAFDLPDRTADRGMYYLGAGVDVERAEEPFDWRGINSEQPLIYCSLGSQNHITSETSRRFLQVAIDTAATLPGLQFIISIGKHFSTTDFRAVPGNVRLSRWVPQLEVLARADLMINHGGFGAIKECVLMGTPMLVFPLRPERDHGECAKRVVYHQLGLEGNVRDISTLELAAMIKQVIEDQSFKQRVALMREKFIEQDRVDIGVKVIEDLLTSRSA